MISLSRLGFRRKIGRNETGSWQAKINVARLWEWAAGGLQRVAEQDETAWGGAEPPGREQM